jgi:hypothetical protein
LDLYGVTDKPTEVFGRQCLLARRFVERGVRFIQIYSGGHHNDANWDAHGDLVHNHNLTYFYNGLDQKLVGVEGAEPIHEVI